MQPRVYAERQIARLELEARCTRTVIGALEHQLPEAGPSCVAEGAPHGQVAGTSTERPVAAELDTARRHLADVEQVLRRYRALIAAVDAAGQETALHWRDRRLAEIEREWAFCDAVRAARLPSPAPDRIARAPARDDGPLPWSIVTAGPDDSEADRHRSLRRGR